MSWIKDFLESTSNNESPQSYYYWSALAAISATVGKRVWLNRGGVYNLYPNIYVFLISKKSGLRKGVPVKEAKKLVYDVGSIRIIDGQNSIQGVLKELSLVHTTDKGFIVKEAEGFLITGEFASFMIQDGVGFSLTTLTDLYDTQYHESGFNKRLASQETARLKNPCITGLFASNETHFFDAVPKNAISGGFLARTFCVYEEKRNKANSLTKKQTKIINYSQIVDSLKDISDLKGEFIMDEEAIKVYDDWYYEFVEREHDDETGTSERISDNLLKAAMLISLSKSRDLLINETTMREAIDKSMECFSSLRRLLFGGNSSDSKNIKAMTFKISLAMMLAAPPEYETTRRKILLKGAGIFGPYELDEAIEHFVQAGMIVTSKRGGDFYYKLKEWMIQKHFEINGGKEIVN